MITGMILSALLSCEESLPQDYRSEEYAAEVLDEQAGNLFTQDSLAVDLQTSNESVSDSIFADSSLFTPGEVNYRVVMPADSIVDGDTAYANIGYAYLEKQGGGDQIILYIDFNLADVTLQEVDGDPIAPVREDIPMEAIAYAPEVMMRLEYELPADGDYLVKFQQGDEFTPNFHLVALNQ